MTADPFAEAMFAASRENNPHRDPQFGEFRDGAQWARDYLSQQEPTAAEVGAVQKCLYERTLTWVPTVEARAALSAARAARRDEEKR